MPSKYELKCVAVGTKLRLDKNYYRALSCIANDIANIAIDFKDNPRDLITNKERLSDAIKRFDKYAKKISATIEDVYNPGKHADSYEGGYEKTDGLKREYPEMKKLLKDWWTDKKDDIIDKMDFEDMYKEAKELDKDATKMEVNIGKLSSRIP
ncbi:MAG: hypothetical protein ACI4PJ_03705 [Acutalibacteraceae bacterium]